MTSFDYSKYADIIAEAERAFLTDTSYAVRIAEAAAAMRIKKENAADPEQLDENIRRLHAQGAGIDEIQRVLHTNRNRIIDATRDAPRKSQDAPGASRRYADVVPEPKPVIPSKKLKKSEPKPLVPDDPRHGTNSGYVNFRCRCAACVEARKVYRAERRANPNPTARAEKSEHGMLSRYTKHGCRCDECRAAATEYARKRRERK
jgi:hypothetical protein